MAKNIKKKNFIVRYFSHFGIRQICDILMLVGAIVLIVGLSISAASVNVSKTVLLIGMIIYIIASGLAIIRSVLVLTSKINHRSPEFKRAITNVIIMSVILLLAVFGLIWAIVV